MFWQISSFPRCEYHVFLSHCALDRQEMVHPVYDELKRRGIILSAWDSLRDRGIFHQLADGDPVTWAVNKIVDFLHREQDLALDMAKVLLSGQPVYQTLSIRPGLVERITLFDPSPIP
jgi:hypothetical protein